MVGESGPGSGVCQLVGFGLGFGLRCHRLSMSRRVKSSVYLSASSLRVRMRRVPLSWLGLGLGLGLG